MLSINEWRDKGGYITLQGHKIFYVESRAHSKEGAIINKGVTSDPKDIILLIHGFPTSSWDWAPIWDELSSRYNLIAMDMLGFGYSDKPNPHTYSIHEQADIMEDFIKALNLNTFHVLAHDYGDTVAQELLARQNMAQHNKGAAAGCWKSVCFLNGGLFPETHKALLIQKLLLSPLGPLINKLTTRRRFDISVSRVFGPETQPSQFELDGFWSLINHNGGRHIFHNLITYMRDRKIHRERWVSALKETSIPLGLINGSVDPVSGAHMIAHYKAIIGEPKYLAQLPTIGHYPQVEAPSDVTQYYLEFLDQFSS